MHEGRIYNGKVRPGVKSNDPNCHNCNHYDDLDDSYNYIVGTLKRSGHMLVSNHTCADMVPGWNEQVNKLHRAARVAYWLWREKGKPRQVDVFNVMKLSIIKLNLRSENLKRT